MVGQTLFSDILSMCFKEIIMGSLEEPCTSAAWVRAGSLFSQSLQTV